jgi:hypothetical protein
MFLGSILIIGGLWWAWDVRRRPEHQLLDYRGPAIMAGIGVAILLGFTLWLGMW